MAVLPIHADAQDFRIEDVAAIDTLPVEQLKPKTIVFADQPGEQVLDASTGFMRFEDWARGKPVQKKFLSLYPGYNEPNEDVIVDGVKKRYREKLHMYVAQARFVLTRPTASLDLASFATLPIRRKDRSSHQAPCAHGRGYAARPKEPKSVHNQNPQRPWCEGRATVICIHSTYKLEGRLPTGIALANKIRESSKRISDTLEFDSELAALSPVPRLPMPD